MGGGGNSAQRAAEAREQETLYRIQGNSRAVNAIFDDPARQAQIGDFTNAVRAQYREELDRQKANNDRSLKFAFARSGQTGGSLAVDTNRTAGEEYNRGVIKSEQMAQGAAADLRASDEESRNRLLALVQSGGDIGTAQANAATQLRNNLQAGRASTDVSQFGDAFARFGSIFENSRKQSEYRRGAQDYGTLYSPTFQFGFNGGSR